MIGLLLLAFVVPPDSVDPVNLHWVETIEDWSMGYRRLIESRVRGIYWTVDKRSGAVGFYRFSPDERLISYTGRLIPKEEADTSDESGITSRFSISSIIDPEEDGVEVRIDEPGAACFLVFNKKTRKYTNFYVIVLPEGK